MELDPGNSAAAGLDAWLRGGGMVVAASERAARALATAFHRHRRAEGLLAWPAPAVQDWQGFVRAAWEARRTDDRLVLNALQERALWDDVLRASAEGRILLDEPRQRMARLAADAHHLLCSYAPQYLTERNRFGWQQDAGAFSAWLREFDSACRAGRLLSSARLPVELLPLLEADTAERPPLLLAGFDRILPVQRSLFDAWGRWAEDEAGERATEARFYRAADLESELEACALWCARRLEADPQARLLVLAQNLDRQRGEIERAFQRFAGGDRAGARFEFSLGMALGKVALGRGALLTLRWLGGPLDEHEIDWLFSTGQGTDGAGEPLALTGFMRALRRRNLQRRQWSLEDLLQQRCGAELPPGWMARMVQARRRLSESMRRRQSPLEWAGLVLELLETAGWPGGRAPASAEFQALRRWQQTVEACASLGFDGRHIAWDEFLLALRRAVGETLFAPESQDAPIQIAGPAEAAGLHADAIWFLGADEEHWPAQGVTHPLLPFAVQREAGMPHSSAQLDLAVAQAITVRVLASAPVVCFSYARQSEGVEARPARLIVQCVGEAETLPAGLEAPASSGPSTVVVEDVSRVPLAVSHASGGSTVLSAQSQCPFKAFATARLAAQGWDAAEAGLTAAQRGQLLHAVLHAVWAGKPDGIRNHEELVAVADLTAFVERHVQREFADKLPAGVKDCMPQRYLELEEIRLTRLVVEWLEYERGREPFAVARTELDVARSVAGLELRLRMDRVDRLKDGSFLVIDYKTGDIKPKVWELPRPEDVQLPLYAIFGLDDGLRGEIAQQFGDDASDHAGDSGAGRTSGLAFAKVRAGNYEFAGRIADAKETLRADLSSSCDLVKKKFTVEELMDWRDQIEELARDFIAGRADVDPRDYPKTCERCDLQAVCRVQEFRPDLEESEEGGDE